MNTSHTLRFTEEAEEDLLRLYTYLLDHAPDRSTDVAERALDAIEHHLAILEYTPYICRKATPDNPYLRELLIPFGAAGYVALFEIEPDETVTVLAVRHQRESDYH
ncbi:MAG: type II toxin-antitoxin system RelE/ParE family toxin [Acidovorax sp.]|uniref:type II toxin-antitoxin system RelE/ParE family toxin n=1 Tax=Acidovorax sp. TaxID=1872122 RepID=UPI0039E7266D